MNITNPITSNLIEKILKYNPLYILWFIVNFTVCWQLLGGGTELFFFLLVAYIISIWVALSPAGERLLRLIESARPILTKQEREYLDFIFEEVYSSVKAQHPYIGNVKLYLQDIMSVNAFAIGSHTIILTKGAVATFSEDELRGILAHEFGHIVHGDTIAVLLNTVGNGFFAIFICLFRIISTAIEILTGTFERSGFIKSLFKVTRIFLDMLIMFFMFIGQAILSMNSRKSEFLADQFAYETGYGSELVSALYLFQRMSLSEKMTVKERLQATHPIFAWRINKMETLIDGEM